MITVVHHADAIKTSPRPCGHRAQRGTEARKRGTVVRDAKGLLVPGKGPEGAVK